jgi:hypothetical protein
MAKTAITDISTEHVLLNPGDEDADWSWGYLAADTAPGSWVIKSGDTWVLLDTDTAANHMTTKASVVGYHKRINQTTGALKIITDNYDVSEKEDKKAPIIHSGIVVAKITDQGATLEVGKEVQASGTGGSCTTRVIVANEGLTMTSIGTVASVVVDDDTFGIFGIGKCEGRIWGGA